MKVRLRKLKTLATIFLVGTSLGCYKSGGGDKLEISQERYLVDLDGDGDVDAIFEYVSYNNLGVFTRPYVLFMDSEMSVELAKEDYRIQKSREMTPEIKEYADKVFSSLASLDSLIGR